MIIATVIQNLRSSSTAGADAAPTLSKLFTTCAIKAPKMIK